MDEHELPHCFESVGQYTSLTLRFAAANYGLEHCTATRPPEGASYKYVYESPEQSGEDGLQFVEINLKPAKDRGLDISQAGLVWLSRS